MAYSRTSLGEKRRSDAELRPKRGIAESRDSPLSEHHTWLGRRPPVASHRQVDRRAGHRLGGALVQST